MKKLGLISLVGLILIGAFIFVRAQTEERKPLPLIEKPKLGVKKSKRQLLLFDDQKLIRTYPMVLGFTPRGDKEIEGDGKTPEGIFYIFAKNPNSAYYLSLGVSYPNIEDANRGLKENIITQAESEAIIKAIHAKEMPPQNTGLGGEIYIHGGGIEADWTAGCAALANEDIKELFDVIPVGTEVKIEP